MKGTNHLSVHDESRTEAADKKAPFYVYFIGARVEEGNQSWCPDCRASDKVFEPEWNKKGVCLAHNYCHGLDPCIT
jgi:hypothetical protein